MMILRSLKRGWCECVLWSVCVCVCVLSGCASGFSHGASTSSCRDLKPGHVGAHHTHHTHTHPAFTLHPSQTEYLPQETLTVTLRSSRAFMGFMLQVRSLRGERVVGEFLRPPPGTQRMSCSGQGDTLTHSDKLLKRNMSFTWRAPDRPSGDVRFYITVVQSYFVYWSRIQSDVVHDGLVRQTTSLSSLTFSSVTDLPATETTAATLPTTSPYSTLDYTHTNLFTHPMSQEPNTTHNVSLHITHSAAHELTKTHSLPSINSNMRSEASPNSRELQPFTNTIHAYNTQTHTTAPTPTHGKYNYSRTTQDVPPDSHTHTHSQTTEYTLGEHTHTSRSNIPPPFLKHTQPNVKHPPTANTQPHTPVLPSISPLLDPSPAPRLSLPDAITPLTPPPRPAYPHPSQTAPPPPPGISRPPATDGTPRHMASELGVLLGCSAGLGVLLTLGLRCLHRRCCRKRSEVCLSERSRRWEGECGVVQVQEYGCGGGGGGGELVQVRRIRQNSLLLLQTEYNLITPPGN